MLTIITRSRNRASLRPGAMRESRQPCRTRDTCRPTFTRWSDYGRNRLRRTRRRWRSSPTIITRRIFRSTRICSSRRMPRPRRWPRSRSQRQRGDRPINFVNFTAKNAMSARYVLERADWAGAAALPFTPTQYPQPDSLIRSTRGLGMARSGDLAGARAEIEAIKALRVALEKSNQSYWADRSEEQILAISAWIALKEGARDEAVKFMRAAADGEDGSVKHVAMENRLYPLRELYAELLLEMGQLPHVLGHCTRRERGGRSP